MWVLGTEPGLYERKWSGPQNHHLPSPGNLWSLELGVCYPGVCLVKSIWIHAYDIHFSSYNLSFSLGFFFLRQNFPVYLRLVWNSLLSSGWIQTHAILFHWFTNCWDYRRETLYLAMFHVLHIRKTNRIHIYINGRKTTEWPAWRSSKDLEETLY